MPIDRGTIDEQLRALGEARWWNERELRDLPDVLNADEQILAISRGKLARVRWLRRKWLIVVTDRRLLCMRSSAAGGWRQREVHAAHITRVTLRVGPFRGRVILTASGHTYRLLVPHADAYKLSAALSSIARLGEHVLTGPGSMARRVVDHVMSLPAAVLQPGTSTAPPALPPAVVNPNDERVELLEAQVHELQRQVEFLEQLLRQRQIG